MKIIRLPRIFDNTIVIFNPDGSFNRKSKKVCLLINSVLMIIGSVGRGNVYNFITLPLELLRCGIYIENEELAKVLLRLLDEKLIAVGQDGREEFLRNIKMN